MEGMEKRHKIKFLPTERSFSVAENQTILEAAMGAGIHINASCSGNGTCGKCRIKIIGGQIKSAPHPKIDDVDYEAGIRLACQSFIEGDATVEIPIESQIDKSALKKRARNAHLSYDIDKDKLFKGVRVNPPVKRIYSELPQPAPEDNLADLGRLLRSFGEAHPVKGPVVTPIDVLRGLPGTLREGQWKVTSTMSLVGENHELTAVKPGDHTQSVYAIAIDIGTTTVCGRLVAISGCNPEECSVSSPSTESFGCVVAEAADYNGQIGYGEDVISRIMYARKKGGLKKLQTVVVKTINGVIKELLDNGGVPAEHISHIVLAGNTTMTHLLLAIDPTHLMLAPYTPPATSFSPISASSLGISVGGDVYAYVFPCVASYIGGDIVSGVIASAMKRSEGITLFMDIGTNGELVLGNRDWLLSASCSAGPAFEGGGIQFGVRAAKGAIEQVRINPSTYEPMVLTIGRATPMGICGSGLIDLVAGLLEAGLIDQKGKFLRDTGAKRVRKGHGCWEYVICWAAETAINKDIVITEIDLDNLIRTKAAIFAGYKVLLDSAGLTFNDLHKIIIAGGFGHYIDVEKAKDIGLLPDLPDDRFRFIGNSSLTGAHLAALDSRFWGEAEDTARMITNLELSTNNAFMDEFVAAMFLPHTNEGLFPEVTARLKG